VITIILEAWIVVASGSTIVDPDQNGSRRAETAGIAADPVARLSASLLFYMAMRITVDVAHLSFPKIISAVAMM
jgi:hypothetical protein